MSTSKAEKLREILSVIALNAEVIPDPRMQGATDCFAVPLEDINEARRILDDLART